MPPLFSSHGFLASCSKELLDESCRIVRILFREEVAAFHRLALRARSPLPPDSERAPVSCVKGVERATFRPEMEHGTFDSLRRIFVSTIVFDIDGRSRSIFLADSVNARRIAIGGDVLLENFWSEGTLAERIMEDGLGCAEKILLRKRILLRQQNPGPVGLSKARVGPAPCFEDGNYVENGESLHVLRMVESQAVRDPSSTIVADQREGGKAELVHHFA